MNHLHPDSRSLYTEALTPPPGHVFDQGLATTFSLDPLTLLTIPMHLVLAGLAGAVDDAQADKAAQPVLLLESLRRIAGRITVYGQRGRLLVPDRPHPLYGLLEPMIVEVNPTEGGVFHPKLWLLRFLSRDDNQPLLRLLVLSRNLTGDRCWDLSLCLEGRPQGGNKAVNRELGQWIAALPELACGAVDEARRQQAQALGDELRRIDWQLPEPFQEVRFHLLNRRRPWTPTVEGCRRLAVISPFLSEDVVARLAGITDEAVALISRPETLTALGAEGRAAFQRCLMLEEAAETEDGEASDQTRQQDTHGLHAKALILETGRDVHLFIGSANATHNAFHGRNQELLVELIGPRRQVGGISDLLDPTALGRLLTDFVPPEPLPQRDEGREAALAALETARERLVAAGLRVVCHPLEQGWRLELNTPEPVDLTGIDALGLHPVTLTGERAVAGLALARGQSVDLGSCSTAAVTGLIAFRLQTGEEALQWVLNLPLDGLPPERETAMLTSVFSNQQDLLRYLELLLTDEERSALPVALLEGSGPAGQARGAGWLSEPLLERLVRSFSREPQRLEEVRKVLERLARDPDGARLIPPQLQTLWAVFDAALVKP